MSRGFPAFFRQFWLHLRKNFRKNLQESTKQKSKKTMNYTFWAKLLNSKEYLNKNSQTCPAHSFSQKQMWHAQKLQYLLFPQNQNYQSLCHLIPSPEFMGLSQHPSATNIQEVTWYSTHLFNPRTPPVQLKFSCSIGKQMRPTCDQVLFEEHQG